MIVGGIFIVSRAIFCVLDDVLIRIGGDLLSHTLRCSTIGATGLIGRVRDGIGSLPRAMSTKPKKNTRPLANKRRDTRDCLFYKYLCLVKVFNLSISMVNIWSIMRRRNEFLLP